MGQAAEDDSIAVPARDAGRRTGGSVNRARIKRCVNRHGDIKRTQSPPPMDTVLADMSPILAEPPLRIGTRVLPSRFSLAPLAGYTQHPFRVAVRELGGLGLATTDLVQAGL